MPRETNIQVRRGTASDWTNTNPTLAQGEPGFETDTKKMKIGNGSTAWNSLPYFSVDGGSLDGQNNGAPTTTTTTTTAAPAGAFTLSGAGNSAVNGCYAQTGTYNGMPYYSNGSYFVWYEGFEWAWFINQSVGTGAPQYMGSDQNNVPSSWSEATGASPAPSLSQGC